jgi:hypothetical protein
MGIAFFREASSMAKQSKQQKQTVQRVMHEYKHGELDSSRGGKVKNPKQAIAIALQEAGASKYQSPPKNKENLRRTKSKEHRGETGQARAGKGASAKKSRPRSEGSTKADLYEQAKRRNIAGRSSMSKHQLARALRA